jgi:uncharacterized protein YndB with AHSA1/START domain
MSQPRKSTRSGTRGYAHLVEVKVPVARVWRALTDPALVRIWTGQDAEIDAREGGMYRIGKRHAGGREAHIDIFDVNRRLRLIYMHTPELPTNESAVVDDFLLDVRKGDGTTSLRLLGSGVPEASSWDPLYVKLRMGWERYMARIKVALESPPKPKVEKKPEPPKDPPLPGLDY